LISPEFGYNKPEPEYRRTLIKPSVNREYFTQGEVARITRLNTRVLDYWSNAFSDALTTSVRNGERYYHREDIKKIFQIKELFVVQRRQLDEVKDALKPPGRQQNGPPSSTPEPRVVSQIEKKTVPTKNTKIIPIKQRGSLPGREEIPGEKAVPEIIAKLRLLRRGLSELLTILDKSDNNNS
jgi:DNA-binding transcriptional MerR regulator